MSTPSVIVTRGVSKRWGTTPALSDVSVEVGPGVTGLLGANGAGKTTLIGLVLGFHRADVGDVAVLGLDPTRSGPTVRARLGYAPEHDALPGDVRAQDLVRHVAELHGIPRRSSAGRASDALQLVGLGEERLRPLGTLSVGQRQRVKLAQAIAHDPALVLLDEPTNGLDPLQRDAMLTLIRRIGRDLGLHVLLSTHLLVEAQRVCDAVVVLDAGRVAASTRLDDLDAAEELVLDLDGDAQRLVDDLVARGVDASHTGGRVSVRGRTADVYRALRDALAAQGAGVRRLQPRVADLEELFFEVEA